MQTLLAQMGVARRRRRAGAVDARRGAHRLAARALRAREDDARVDPGARPAARALRRGARVAARRLRDRPAARRPARQGPGGDGRRRSTSSTATSARARRGCTGARIRVRRRHRHRHREPDDGGDARRRHDRARERRARAGGRRARALPRTRWARASAAPAPTASSIEGVARAARRDARDHARPHRDGHVPRRGGRDRRRRRAASARAPDTLEAVHRQAARGGRRRSPSTATTIRVRAQRARCAPSACAPRRIPGFPTDMQAQFMALATRAEGTSVITETIFENRIMHVQELRAPGRRHRGRGQHRDRDAASPKLTGADVMATDLRASACLVIAGLMARGRDDDRPHLPPRSRLRAHRAEALGGSARASSA